MCPSCAAPSIRSCLPRLAALILVLATTAVGESWRAEWGEIPDRTWLGSAWWANRLHDWRVLDGAAECAEDAPGMPVRTACVLTHVLDPARGGARLVLRLERPEAAAMPDEAFGGLLVGAGGPGIDHRLTALVHHRPAEDGGLLAILDAHGAPRLLDFGAAPPGGALWSLGGPLDPATVPELPCIARRAAPAAGARPSRVDLVVAIEPEGEAATVALETRDAATGAALGAARYEGVPRRAVEGAIALVSHRHRHRFVALELAGDGIAAHPERTFGPVAAALWTRSGGVLKLAAQCLPHDDGAAHAAALQVRADGAWRTVATAPLDPDAHVALFRVAPWDDAAAVPYRVVVDGDEAAAYAGELRAARSETEPATIAALNCHKIYTGGLRWNHDGLWFPHAEVVAGALRCDPDLVFFAGDQIYEGDLDPAVRRPLERAMLDYLGKWYRWCWAFGALVRDRPSVTIPDDHDVYHGNLWGAGGVRAEARDGITAQDSGGYVMPPRFVNMVHRTQTSHLPDPVDPAPCAQGISVYFTRLVLDGVDCAIVADRQFKSAPTVAVPEGRVVNGWFQAEGFDPAAQADVPGAQLLGARQEAFLDAWSRDWSQGAWFKVVLSQTPFANVATRPPGPITDGGLPQQPPRAPGDAPTDWVLAADADSGGWPQSARDRALRAMRRGYAIHLSGDQHLASLVSYGVEAWRDAGVGFCAPAIANTWPRRWYPPIAGAAREPGAPSYTGDFRDGFGNRVTVHAVANPEVTGHAPALLHDRAPGYGIVRLDRASRTATFECWPRWCLPGDAGAQQYAGWPRTFAQLDLRRGGERGRVAIPWPTDARSAVVTVIDESSGETESVLRLDAPTPVPVFGTGPWTVTVESDDGRLETREHASSAP